MSETPIARLRTRVASSLPADRWEALALAVKGLRCAWAHGWAVALGIAIAIFMFGSSGHDDSHITMWSAYALAEFGEIVNHSGQRVEQSSSLLHTIILAVAYRLTGVQLPWLGYVFGILFAALTVIRLPVLGGLKRNAGAFRLAAGTAPLLTYWALGGLETTLFCWVSTEFLIAVSRVLEPRSIHRRGWAEPAIWSLLLAMTRPEASIVAICALVAVVPFAWWRDRRCALRAVALVAINLAIAALLLRWRLSYFGDPFPHPVSAKMGDPDSDLSWQAWLGTRQLYNLFARADALPMLAGLVGGVLGLARDVRRRDATRPLITAFGGAYLSFIICVGGDWMLGGRFLAHAAPLLLLLFFVELDVETWSRRRAYLLGLTIMLANLIQTVHFTAAESMGRPAWNVWQVLPAIEANAGTHDFAWVELVNKPHGRDAIFLKELDPIIDRIVASEGKVSILSVQAGMIMYYLARQHYGKVEFVDHAGLVSRHYDALAAEIGMTHNRLGLDWSLADTLRLSKYRDGVEFQPDVIFDLYSHSHQAARSNDYVIVFLQQGTMTSAYTPPPEVDDEEETEEPPEILTPEEQAIKRLRERFEDKRERREINFFGAKKGFYQFIAVRRDIAQKLGWDRDATNPDGSSGGRRVREKRWNWDEVRVEHLRYFEDEEEQSDDE